MNYPMVLYLLGWALNCNVVLSLFPCLVALVYREDTLPAFLIPMGVSLLLGFLLTRKRPEKNHLHARDGFLSVALIWVVLSVLGCLPFVLSGEIPHFVDALFEMVSGYTTTGASILTDVEALSQSMLFWRSFSHWVGGMGVLMLLLAVLPMMGGDHFHLMRAESPGPTVQKLDPKLRTTALTLYLIYFCMTVLQVILLLFAGMSFFDALITTFGSAGTGGFSNKADSLAGFSPAAQAITAVFMMLFGVNFSVFYLLTKKQVKQALGSEELRVYIGIMLAATALIAIDIRGLFSSFWEVLNHAYFQVSSVMTTTGYATADFDQWPTLAKTILVLLMFIGASAGSTGGGIKVSRIVILFKIAKREVFYYLHPRGVQRIRFEERALPDDTTRAVGVYFVVYFLLFAVSLLLVSFDQMSFTTNFTAIAATFNNIGPGLEVVGPAGSFQPFSNLSKLVMIFDMLAGRLELYPMLLLLVPSAWKR